MVPEHVLLKCQGLNTESQFSAYTFKKTPQCFLFGMYLHSKRSIDFLGIIFQNREGTSS